MGWQPHAARLSAWRFRKHSIELMEQMAPHFAAENKLIAMVKQGRAQLEEMWARERQEQAAQRARTGWHAPAAKAASGGEDERES